MSRTTDSARGAALLDTKAAAAFLSVSTRTLESWRRTGQGPRVIHLSARACRYRPGDIEAWLESRTSEVTA
jgi:predicted DNA-binding transcriptional regulator AlpA